MDHPIKSGDDEKTASGDDEKRITLWTRIVTELADLFPGFSEHRIETAAAHIFARVGGDGPPVLLLHGYPQTHVCWHRVAPALAERFTLVIPDLRGYGASGCPQSDAGHHPYSKRAMGADMVELMGRLGHERFHLVGHDRGARVAYRLALDYPYRVDRLAVLDIAPTGDAWAGFSADEAMAKFHWPFLAQAEPLPETLIGANPIFWLETLMMRWSGSGDLSRFDPRALAHYRAAFDAAHIHASCEDYRAGATADRELDERDRREGRKIECPTLVLWGSDGGISAKDDLLGLWKGWCAKVEGRSIPSGHFLPEEAPDETATELLAFLSQRWS